MQFTLKANSDFDNCILLDFIILFSFGFVYIRNLNKWKAIYMVPTNKGMSYDALVYLFRLRLVGDTCYIQDSDVI